MARTLILTAAALSLITTVAGAQAVPAGTAAALREIRVPQGAPRPVLLDGQLSPGEWDDASSVTVQDDVRLLLKEAGGYVFLAVSTGTRVPRPIDIFVQDSDGRIHQLHASMQIGERILADTLWTDAAPAWRWGNHVAWMANEAKLDSTQPTTAVWTARLFPADGTEFQIRRSRFAATQWRVRVEVNAFTGTETSHVFPRGANRDPSTWAVLRLD